MGRWIAGMIDRWMDGYIEGWRGGCLVLLASLGNECKKEKKARCKKEERID